MDVSVVITCWNGRKLLEKNLPKVIEASANPQNHISEVIVVDDYSTDNSVEFLKNNYPQVKLVRQEKNYGYSVTCNTGVEKAKSGLVVILNLDVVPAINFLENVLPHFKDEKVFSVSFNEGKFGPGKLVWENGMLGIAPTKILRKTCLTGWPSGGSSVFRKDIWQKLGGMDSLFLPFYYEDIDLGIRAFKAGFKCLFEPKSKVEHEHEATINPQNFSEKYILRVKERNRLLLTWKNLDSLDLILSHIKALVKIIFLSPGFFRIILKAIKRIGLLPLFLGKDESLEEKLSTEQVLKLNEKIN